MDRLSIHPEMPDRITETIRRRYDRIARFYDTLQRPMEKMLAQWRGELIGHVQGRVLEVGVGTGQSLSWYPAGVALTGIDFSPEMIREADRRLSNTRQQAVTLRLMDVQNMSFEDASFDTVVSMCVFCSVPHPERGFREIRRVCRPGGKLLMLEHVRSDGPFAGPFMDLINWLPSTLYGAHINRRTVDGLRRAGFTDICERRLWRDILKMIVVENRK